MLNRILLEPQMKRNGFTLIEILVVVTIISLLIAVLLPGLSAARERATVVRASAELRLIGDGLDGYSMENNDKVPPGRTYCEMDKADQWCDLPVELTKQRWIHKGSADGIISSVMLDVFNPEHTYKYMAPGRGFHNGGSVRKTLWIPSVFPQDSFDVNPTTLIGTDYDNLSTPRDSTGGIIPSPVKWVIWSLGPRFDENRYLATHAPIPRCSWYRGTGTNGVIPRIRSLEGETFALP